MQMSPYDMLTSHSKVFMKLENLQPSGSFKSRGIGNFVKSNIAKSALPTPVGTNGANTPVNGASANAVRLSAHFYCSSGGNAGLACATAAAQFNQPCTIVVPQTTKQFMIDKIRAVGKSEVIVNGASWQEADAYLRDNLLANDAHGVYVHPFDHPDVWKGHASMVEEIAAQWQDVAGNPGLQNGTTGPPDAIICSVGGGGLLNGIVQGKMSPSLNQNGSSPSWASTPIIAMETRGAESLAASVAAGELVTLPAITSQATSLGARRVCDETFRHATDPEAKVIPVVLTDEDAARACVRFADEERIMVELACGVSAAMCYDETGRLEKILKDYGRWKGPDTKIVLIVCGGSVVTTAILEKWRSEMVAN